MVTNGFGHGFWYVGLMGPYSFFLTRPMVDSHPLDCIWFVRVFYVLRYANIWSV